MREMVCDRCATPIKPPIGLRPRHASDLERMRKSRPPSTAICRRSSPSPMRGWPNITSWRMPTRTGASPMTDTLVPVIARGKLGVALLLVGLLASCSLCVPPVISLAVVNTTPYVVHGYVGEDQFLISARNSMPARPSILTESAQYAIRLNVIGPTVSVLRGWAKLSPGHTYYLTVYSDTYTLVDR